MSSQQFFGPERLRALVSLWGKGQVTLVRAFEEFVPEEEKKNYNSASDKSTFLTQKIKNAFKKSNDDDKWRSAFVEGLGSLGSGVGVAADHNVIEKALLGDVETFWQFLLNSNPYGGSPGRVDNTPQADSHVVTDFELMGARKDSLRTFLGVLREGVFDVSEKDFEEARTQTEVNGGEEPVVRRCAYLYRLGLENLGDSSAVELNALTHKYNFVSKGFGLVIRRVPACFIFSASDPYRVRYQEHYKISVEDFRKFGRRRRHDEILTAEAFGYAYSDCLALISRDVVRKDVVRPSLTQLDWKKGENSEDGEVFLPGVITMESDIYQRGLPKPPTAYRVVVKLLDKGKHWEEIRETSYTKLLIDQDDNELFSELDRRTWSTEDVEPGHSRSWSDYFDMLNICDNPLDLLVARQLRERVD